MALVALDNHPVDGPSRRTRQCTTEACDAIIAEIGADCKQRRGVPKLPQVLESPDKSPIAGERGRPFTEQSQFEYS